MHDATLPDKFQSLQIRAEQPLSAEQNEFNQLITSIERLRREIAQEEQKLEALLLCAQKHLLPALERIAKAKIGVAIQLENAALEQQLGKRQLSEVGICIAGLCRQAFVWIDPTKEEQALHDRWAFEQEQIPSISPKQELKTLFEDQAEDILGESVDWDSLVDDPERMQALMDAIEEQRAQAAERARTQAQSKSKQQKTSKKEALQQAAEALKTRSIRAVYIALAKLLHPDLEPEPSLRPAKEEEMKKVAAAYAANDLSTLLHLEMDWIQQQGNRLGSIAEDKLMVYIEVLKGQVKELQDEKTALPAEPRYAWVREFGHGKQAAGLQKIKAQAGYLDEVFREIEALGRSFQAGNGRRRMTDYVKTYMRFLGEDEL